MKMMTEDCYWQTHLLVELVLPTTSMCVLKISPVAPL
jgi:hypothetical protein